MQAQAFQIGHLVTFPSSELKDWLFVFFGLTLVLAREGYSLAVVPRLLTPVASLVAERGSRAQSSYSTQALLPLGL